MTVLNKLHPHKIHYSVPGKTILLGEYSVLCNGNALVATLPHRFVLESSDGSQTFVKDSPAGKLLERNHVTSLSSVSIRRPLNGRGGIGGSTAEFALLYSYLYSEGSLDSYPIWKSYRGWMGSKQEFPPSGADLFSQCRGGLTYFISENPKKSPLLEGGKLSQALSQMDVFLADERKTPTHLHLQSEKVRDFLKDPKNVSEFSHKVESGVEFLVSGQIERFGQTMTDYAEGLSHWGLEHPMAREDRLGFQQISGVLGCKGNGAFLSDTITVVHDGEWSVKQKIMKYARERNLVCIADGLGLSEPGLVIHE